MAPKASDKNQKTLNNWFTKGPTTTTPSGSLGSNKPKPKVSTSVKDGNKGSASSTKVAPKTPLAKDSSSSSLNLSSSPGPSFSTPLSNRAKGNGVAVTNASESGSSYKDTPPTSDPVDVDMLSPDEEEIVPKPKGRLKRKMSIADSDEEIESIDAKAYKNGLSAYRPSPEHEVSNSRAKKQRVAPIVLDSDEEEEGARPSFAGRLNKFKKSPTKKARKSKSEDDDDFIAPDDDIELPDDEDDDERPSRASSRSSGRFSRASSSHRGGTTDADDDMDEDDDEPSSKSKKQKAPRRPALKQNNGASAGGGGSGMGSNSFMTKAEMRAMATKDEKKAQENPFSFLLDPMDKDKVRPGEKGYDPRTLYIPKSAWNEFSPFETQFWEIKQNHYDTVLFFQKGKFLELYEEDARIGHREFDLKLTQRVKMSMVGVPEMSFNFWAAKFLAKGYKVGRVEQVETALGAEMRLASDKAKGKKSTGEKIVRRELDKVYTNGTLVDEDLLTDDQAGHCVSIRESEADDQQADDTGAGGGSFGVCVLDSSTSEFNLCAFEDDVCRTRLETLMRQLRVKEIVFTKGNLSVETTRLLKTLLPSTCLWTSLRDQKEGLDYEATVEELKTLYPPDSTSNSARGHTEEEQPMTEDEVMEGMEGVPPAIRSMLGCKSAVEALGSMIWYLRQLNIDKDILTMRNFNVYDPMKRGQGLVLDGQTLAHIEVLVNNEGTEEGSLLELLGRCVTPFGKRLFRIWLCMPLRETKDINARLDAIEDLMQNLSFEEQFVKIAKGLPDLERIVSRIHAKSCKVKDFLKVLSAFRRLSEGLAQLADAAEDFKSKTILGLLRSAPDLEPHIKNVESKFKRPDKENTDELIPVEGKDEAYDEISAEIKELEDGLEKELRKLKKQLGYDLTYWHSAQGTKEIYLVQTKAGEKDIPKDWVKSGATKAATRWVVPSLTPTIRSLKEARETRNATVKSFKLRLFEEFDKDRGVWLRAVRVLAELDCLFSLAKSSQAMGEPVCRPEFVESNGEAWVDFTELRHPALAMRTKGDFIPNDVKLGGNVGRIALLTGPNMGGKSTVMRMTATGVIMAQLGMYVPAQQARLSPVDSILTRMGAYDNMFSNASTFKVELDECCKILRDATPRSLVILDELGRGTSTYDGMAIAGAVLHQLATHTLALTFFATHYGSLTDDFAYHPNIRNMHMQTMVDDEKRELVFLYKLIDGVASSSFGTHVANLAGVPLEVVQRAELVSKDFARQFKEKVDGKRKKSAAGRLPLVAQANFAFLYGLTTGQREMDADPVRRRDVLRRMKGEVLRCLEAAGL